ncbi:MAG: hypothetical protein GY817_01180 [bacterium]|nr:hypothetical protein [bacterium]
MAKPTSKPEWTDGTPANREEPDGSRKSTGFLAERPPFQWWNWLIWIIGQWVNYLEEITDYLKTKVTNDGSNHVILQADEDGQGVKLQSKSDGGTLIDNFIADKDGHVGFSGVGYGVFNYFNDSGVANAYVLSKISGATLELKKIENGTTAWFRTTNANTSASTVNVEGTGVKAIKYLNGSTDLVAGAIPANTDIKLKYNGSVWLLCNEPEYKSGNLLTDGNFENVSNWALESGMTLYTSTAEPIFGQTHGQLVNDGTGGGGLTGCYKTVDLKTPMIENKYITTGLYLRRYVSTGGNTVGVKIKFLNSSWVEISSVTHLTGYGAATAWTPYYWNDIAPAGTQVIRVYIQSMYSEDLYLSSVFCTLGKKPLFGAQPSSSLITSEENSDIVFRGTYPELKVHAKFKYGRLEAYGYSHYIGSIGSGGTIDFYLGRYMSGILTVQSSWGGATGVKSTMYFISGQSFSSYINTISDISTGGGSHTLSYLGYTDYLHGVVRFAQQFRVTNNGYQGSTGSSVWWTPFVKGSDQERANPIA